jgi:hypothetical protein
MSTAPGRVVTDRYWAVQVGVDWDQLLGLIGGQVDAQSEQLSRRSDARAVCGSPSQYCYSSKETYYAGNGFCSVDLLRILVHSNLLGVHRARNDDRRHTQRVPVENRVRPPSLRSARRAGGRERASLVRDRE